MDPSPLRSVLAATLLLLAAPACAQDGPRQGRAGTDGAPAHAQAAAPDDPAGAAEPAARTALARATSPEQDTSALAAFRYDPARVPVGTAFHYRKSNIDGTRPSRVSVYVATADSVESLKWREGEPGAMLVAALLDWDLFSVRRFASWILDPDGGRRPGATLAWSDAAGGVVLRLGEVTDTTRPSALPWHTYDFDLVGLSLVMPHLVEPERPFRVVLLEPVLTAAGARFVEKGPVDVVPEATEARAGVPARRWRIDGPGLENRGGLLWTALDGGHIVDYEIALPDEPGHASGKLELLRTERLTADAWAALVARTAEG